MLNCPGANFIGQCSYPSYNRWLGEMHDYESFMSPFVGEGNEARFNVSPANQKA